MLLEIRISNLALIERAEIQCGPGLNVLTGETGAGKSILIHALGLLVGERATSEQVGPQGAGNGVAKARVEGAFDLSRAPRAAAWLSQADFPADENQLVITREITADGRGRVRINGQMATASALRELGSLLVDLHGQHEHQLLLRADTHLLFLDEFGNAAHNALRDATRQAFGEWRTAQRRLDELTADEQKRAQRLDMLQFQAQEIDAVAPEADEDAQLTDERARLMNAEKLRAAAALCRDALLGGDEPGASTLLGQALKAAREIEAVDGRVAAWVEELQSAIYEIDDAAAEARAYADALDADPLRLEDIETRLHRLNRLKRKYGQSIESVLAYRREIEDELGRLNVSEEELSALREAARARHADYLKAAQKLSKSRRALAKGFEAQVIEHLRTLAMERTRFEVGFGTDGSDESSSGTKSDGALSGGSDAQNDSTRSGTAEGIDRVEFLFSANPGQPLRPLARIASGGEISRVMLALRSALFSPDAASIGAAAKGAAAKGAAAKGAAAKGAAATSDVSGEDISNQSDDGAAAGVIPVLVFDEVDTGIGGVTAEAVGEKMRELAHGFQVFCVTHLPQIARRADGHYRVLKESDEAQTRVSVNRLEGDDRVRELARMMGRESEATLRHARELLQADGVSANSPTSNGAASRRKPRSGKGRK